MLLRSDPASVAGASITPGLRRRVLRLARPYRAMLIGFVATIVVAAVVDLVPPLLFRRIVDTTIPDKNLAELTVVGVVVVIVAFVSAGLSFAERWWSARIGEGLIYDLRDSLFDHVQRMPVAFFTQTQTGALISRLNNDVIGAQRAFTATLGSVVSNAIVLTTTLVAMLLLEWRLTLLALALLPLFIWPAKRVGRRLAAITREGFEVNAEMNTTMTERFGIGGAMLVKLFGRYDTERTEFADRARRVRDIGVTSAMLGRIFFTALALVAAVGTAVVYWVGGRMVIEDVITLGTLVAMAAYVTRIYQPLTALTNARVDVMTAMVSFDRVFEVLDQPNPITDRPGAVDLVDPRGEVSFDDVSFAYPAGGSLALPGSNEHRPEAVATEDAAVLHHVSTTVGAGTTVALVGPSGAGKTSLSSLVPRLYDVSDGAVRVDGRDVRDLTQASLRRAIGVVSQDPHLFHESIRDNLRYARPDATDAELEAACRAARIHDLVAALPEGYDTVVGERGYRLSGGEKQRLAIARMLLKDPAVVILDEATSHLDAENEAAIQAALADALDGRTALVIAHRLSTIVEADKILVLEDGRLVDEGTHAELLARGGLYADLYRTLVRDGDADADVVTVADAVEAAGTAS